MRKFIFFGLLLFVVTGMVIAGIQVDNRSVDKERGVLAVSGNTKISSGNHGAIMHSLGKTVHESHSVSGLVARRGDDIAKTSSIGAQRALELVKPEPNPEDVEVERDESRACSGTLVYSNTGMVGYFPQSSYTAIADDIELSVGGGNLNCYDISLYGSGSAYDVTAQIYTDDSGSVGSPIAGTDFSWTNVSPGSVQTLEANLSTPVSIPQNVWLVLTISDANTGWEIAEDAETGDTEDIFALESGGSWGYYWFSGDPYAGFAANLYVGTVGPANDACSDAEEISGPFSTTPVTVTGTTTNANTDTVPACGDNSDGPFNNVWYYLTGTGNTMTASLCNTVPEWDTRISVFCYNCDYPQCIDGDDDTSGCGVGGHLSTVSWCSEAGATYYITVGGKTEGTTGDFTLDITDDMTPCSASPCCEVTCPSGSTAEGETCDDTTPPNDTTNGGCNSDPTVFGSISCGETICGNAWANNSYRDTDWYNFTLSPASYYTVTVSGESEFPIGVYVMEDDNCTYTGQTYLAETSDPCTSFSFTSDVMPSGNYHLVIVPSTFDGYPCGTFNDYYVTLTCTEITTGACCDPMDPSSCTPGVDQATCEAMYGGTGVWHPGVSCSPNPCVIEMECNDAFFYHQPDGTTAYTSDVEQDLLLYDSFTSLDADICDVHWFGLKLYHDGSTWNECTEDPMDFTITFYEDDNGYPGTASCTYNVSVSGVDTNQTFAGYTVYYFSVDSLSPCCDISDGWISIQGASDGDNCWFLWIGSDSGLVIDGHHLQYDGSSLTLEDDDLNFCLTNPSITEGACCNATTGNCDFVDEATCNASGGTWYPGLSCDPNLCPQPAPANDDCENAEQIPTPYPQTVFGTTRGATVDCPGDLDWNAVWYKFDAPYTRNKVLIDYCDTTTTSYDVGAILYVEPADPSTACPTDCSDFITYDNGSFVTCSNGTSNAQLEWLDLPGPQTYYLPVWLGELGKDFGFTINVTEYSPPANDDCADAEQIPTPYPQIVSGTTVDASGDCPGVLDYNAVWYKFDVPYTVNNVSVDFCLTSEDIYSVGTVLYPEPTNPSSACPDDCNGYIIADSSYYATCSNGTTNPTLYWYNLSGPATYYFPVEVNADAYGTPMAFSFEIDVEDASCDVTCPGGGTAEGETCGDDPDVTNGGCNSSPEVFTSISCGETICGTSYADGGSRDTDWFTVTVSSRQMLVWTVEAEFPVNTFILNGDCSNLYTLASGYGDPCETVEISANVPAGTYYLFVAPGNAGGAIYYGYPCAPTPYEYTATLECQAACDVTCPPGGISEGENCGDSTNDGCSLTTPDPNAVTPVNCDDVICGLAFADGSTRDVDWYKLTTTEYSTVSVEVEAEFPVTVYILSADCDNLESYASAAGNACETVTASANLGGGDYFVFIAPSVYDGYPCSAGPWEYTATFTCTALPVPAMSPFGLGLLLAVISGLLGVNIFRKRR